MTQVNEKLLTHFARFNIAGESEVVISLDFKLLPKTLDRQEVSKLTEKLVEEVPQVYFFIDRKAEFFNNPISPNRLYRINYGRSICLQTFTGITLYLVTCDTSTSIRLQGYEVPFELETTTSDERMTSYGGKLDFTRLKDYVSLVAVDQDGQSLMMQSLRRQIGGPYNFMNRKLDCSRSDACRYILSLKSIRYEYFKSDNQHISSKNWNYPQMRKIAHGINQLRQKAYDSDSVGPRVLVMGPSGSGKGNMLKTIMNTALADNWHPMLVDIDVGQGSIGIPGTVGIGKLSSPFEPDQIIGQECGFETGYPLLIHYGSTKPDESADMYSLALDCLVKHEYMSLLREKTFSKENDIGGKRSPHVGQSGLLVNTHGFVRDFGFNSIMHLIKELKINHIFVHGDRSLHANVFFELFGFQYLDWQEKITSNAPLPKYQAHVKGSELLNEKNVHFLPTMPMQPRHNQVLRYHMRRERIAVNLRKTNELLEKVEIGVDNHSIFELFRHSNNGKILDKERIFECRIAIDGNRKDKIRLYQCDLKCKEMLDKLQNRILSIMDLPKSEVLKHTDTKNQHFLDLMHLLLVNSLARVADVIIDQVGDKHKLVIELPSYLVDNLLKGELFILLNGESVACA